MGNPITELLEKINETNHKLQKGAQIFANIDAIEIGTAEKELVWEMDKVKVYHYKRDTPPTIKTPVVISYALINRFYMMDLQPDRSLIRNLLGLGLDIYIIDTGYPTRNERYLRMHDYINIYMDEAIDFVCQKNQTNQVNLMGICQGGTFSVIYTALHPQKIKNLITLVTPIDFSRNDGLLFRWARDMDVDAIVEGFGGLVPGTFLDVGFQLLKPMLKVRKQNNLMKMMGDEKKLMNFLRMEKWINDLPDQAGETYRQFIKDLYQQNKLIQGELVIGEETVELKNITMPVLTIYASEDHLVPPSSTKPLNDAIGSTDKQLYEFPGGHIGVFTGRRSQAELSPTIHKFLEQRDANNASQSKASANSSKTTTKENVAMDIPENQKRPDDTKEEKLHEIAQKAKDFDFSIIGMADANHKSDLKTINGIGPSIEEKLNAFGIFTFTQISKLNTEQLEQLATGIGVNISRIEREAWVNQAKSLV